MSVLTALGRSLLKVETKSALEEALKAMPNQKMSSQEILSGLKNRGVQNLEIKQSGVKDSLKTDMFDKPQQILDQFDGFGRRDKYTITEYKGIPYRIKPDNGAAEIELKNRWSNLLSDDVEGAQHLSSRNFDDVDQYIIELKINLEDMANSIEEGIPTTRQAELTNFYDTQLAKARDIKGEVFNLNQNNIVDIDTAWTALINEGPFRTSDNFNVVDDIDNYISELRFARDDLEVAMANTTDTRAEDMYSELSDHLDDVHRFKESMGTEAIDVVRPTQTFIDEAEDELRRLAGEGGDLTPDVNNPDEVNLFLDEILDRDNREFIDQFQTSYNQLQRHIEAGDTEITIPNFNTRQVFGNVRYTFEHSTYRDFSLPDTDDASYFARVYDNPAVDHKGIDSYGHFDTNKGLFHVRGDSPQPGVHRIQEIQSDVQNQLTNRKQAAITEWRDTPTTAVTKDEILSFSSTESKTHKEIRALTNDRILTDIEDELDISQTDLLDNLLLQRTEMDGFIEDDLYSMLVDDVLLYNGKNNLSRSALNFISNNLDAHLVPPPSVVKNIAEQGDHSIEQVETIIDVIQRLHGSYDAHLSEVMKYSRFTANELRVTPEQRLIRIKSGRGTKEEQALNTTSLHEVKDFLYMEHNKLELDISRVNNENTLIAEIHHAIVQSKRAHTPESVGTILETTLQEYRSLIDDGVKGLTPLKKFPDANDFNLPIPWIKQGLQEEIVTAINAGKKEIWLTMNPTGVDKLQRGAGPHKMYMQGGATHSTFKSLAKRFKAEIKEEDGYLKMILPKAAAIAGGTLAISSYASTNSQDFITNAREAGIPDDEINAYMEENNFSEIEQPLWAEQAIAEGVSEIEIKQYQHEQFIKEMDESEFAEHPGVARTDLPTIDGSVRYDKLPTQIIRDIANELQIDPSTPMGIDAIYEEVFYKNNPGMKEANQRAADLFVLKQARSDIADFIELHDFWNPGLWMASMMGSGAAEEAYRSEKERITKDVLETGKEHGYDLIYGQGQKMGNTVLEPDTWYVNIEGKIYEANPGFLAMISREGGEISGAILGGIKGGQIVDRYTRSWDAYPPTRLMKVGAVTIGVIAGAFIGDQIDYTTTAIRQHENFVWGVAKDKALGSVQLSILGEIAGLALFKVGKASWRGISRAYNMAVNGNIDGAYNILLRSLDITDDQAKELVARWEAVNQKEAPTLKDVRKWYNPRSYLSNVDKEKAVAVLPTSKAGGEHIMPAIAEKNPRASAAVVSEINQRAKSLVRATSGSGEGARRRVAAEIIDSINIYRANVQDYYAIIKQQGGELSPTGYSFDIDELAIQPILDDIINTIYPHQQRQAAVNKLVHIDKLTTSRTFEDLIELRQVINTLGSPKSTKRATYEALNNVKALIDEEIEHVSTQMGSEGSQWFVDWAVAKADYSEMKALTNNALAKILQRPGINEKVVAQALVKYGTALDGTYNDLIKQLPLEVQPNVEALIIDNLVETFTDGNVTQLQATNFPLLSKALADYNFVWPQSRTIRGVVDKFAEIYQNDNALSYASGGISTTKFQSYLTVDPVVRAQFEVASGFFNQIKILAGGGKGDAAALIKISAKLLENPLNPHNVEAALNAVQDDAVLRSAVKKLSADTAAAHHAGRSITAKIKMYKDGRGKMWTKAGEGRTEVDGIPMHRVTNEEVAKKIAKVDTLDDLSDIAKERLLHNGFTAIGLEDGTILILN